MVQLYRLARVSPIYRSGNRGYNVKEKKHLSQCGEQSALWGPDNWGVDKYIHGLSSQSWTARP